MNVEMLLLVALAGVTVLSALGVLLSKDNFYSSLFMSLTLIMVASVYALFDLQPVFVLVVFIFVGAIGIVTVALAATYRTAPEAQFSIFWTVPVIITAAVLGFSIYSCALRPTTGYQVNFALEDFITPEYLLLIIFLTSLLILLLLSVINLYRGES